MPPPSPEPQARGRPTTLVIMDPLRRLGRIIPGESLHAPRGDRERLFERAREVEKKPLVPERERAFRTGETRESTVRVSAGPNAPKLIRLVRHPYALDQAWPERIDAGDRSRPRIERRRVAELVARDEGRWQREPTRTPFRDDSIFFHAEARLRPSADAWLDGAAPERT